MKFLFWLSTGSILTTAIAPKASDIVLPDDSFGSIINAVIWGRSLYKNIQRFILFQLTINVAALGIVFLGSFLGVAMPLTIIQMLWVNLIMDAFAALALATEPLNPEVMAITLRNPEAFIITPKMLCHTSDRWVKFFVYFDTIPLIFQSKWRSNDLRTVSVLYYLCDVAVLEYV